MLPWPNRILLSFTVILIFFFFQADRRIWRPLEPNLGPSPFPFANSKKKDILHNFSQMETYFWQICRSSTLSFCFWPRSPLHPKFFKLSSPSTPPILQVRDHLLLIWWFLLLPFLFFAHIMFSMYSHSHHFSCDWRAVFFMRKIHFHFKDAKQQQACLWLSWPLSPHPTHTDVFEWLTSCS